jgi:outer membrane receptor protein involved in Fe transport
VEQDYRSELEIYTAEAQHIWQSSRFTTVIGGRFQGGGFDNENEQRNFRVDLIDLFPDPVIASQDIHTRFQRTTVYGYEQWQVADSVRLVGGLSYERLVSPVNYRFAPLSPGTETDFHLLPKAGVIWTPDGSTTLRAAYSKSVGGASFDQSFQLEPTQVAGFNQAFRSLIPESLAGANAGATFTSHGISLERKLSARTHLALTGELLESTVSRNNGAFEFVDLVGTGFTTLHERLDFREQSMSLAAHQLVGREWAFGAIYRVSRANLHDDFTGVSDQVGADSGFTPRTKLRGTIQTLDVHGIYQHPSGFFSRLNGSWTQQSNKGYPTTRPNENFWQWDFLAGYRFSQRRAELTLGVLNLTDQNYQLNALNLHHEKPRDRTFVAQFRFHF